MGGEDDVEKVGRTSGKILTTPLLKPEKTTGVLNVLIMCPGWHFQGSADQESFMTKWKLLVASSAKTSDNSAVVSGRSVKCNAIFAVCDLWALGFKRCCLVCSPVWILNISNIWKHHAKVRTTDIHNIVLYAKIWFHGRKTFWILRLFNISALPSLWQLHVTGALGRSWQLKSAFLDSKRH